jgi:hypothetical protein
MSIDDKLEKTIGNLSDQEKLDVLEETLFALIAAIPMIGGSINSLLTGVAKHRVIERATEVFSAVKERLEQVEESKIDRAFFESEEFQTLLTLVLEQLQSSHDKAKMRMLSAALVNSGMKEFSVESRKELFLRILRDLAPNHLQALNSLLPSTQRFLEAGSSLWPTNSNPGGEALAVLQSLAAKGLVNETLKYDRQISLDVSPASIKNLKKYLEEAPSRVFKINSFGLEFLRFMGQPMYKDQGSPGRL